MEFKTAIFDFDGTIADSMPMWSDFASRFVTHLGGVPREGLNKLVNAMSVQEAEIYLQKEYFPHMTLEQVIEKTDIYVMERYKKGFAPKDGIENFVKKLYQKGVSMAISTATDREPVSLALSALGLSNYFKCIVTCTDAGIGKSSSPAVFDLTLQKIGAKKEETIIFEDSFYAAKTAKEAGYCVAGIFDEFSKAKKADMQAICDYYFDDFYKAEKTLL